MNTTFLGYPKIGARRELEFATEGYWAERIDADTLEKTGAELRQEVWRELRAAELDTIPSNTFSFYDQMLGTSVLFDAIPQRYRHLDGLERYFATPAATSSRTGARHPCSSSPTGGGRTADGAPGGQGAGHRDPPRPTRGFFTPQNGRTVRDHAVISSLERLLEKAHSMYVDH